MPFKSEKQRKYLWANEPEIARDWTDTYGSKIQAAQGGRIGFYRGSPHSSGRGPGPGGQSSASNRGRDPGPGPGGQSGDRGGSLGSGPHGGEWSGPSYSKPDTVTVAGPNVHGEGIGSQTFNKNLRNLQRQQQYQQGAYQRAHPFLSKVKSGLGSLGRGIGHVARNFNPVSLAFDNPVMKLLTSGYGRGNIRDRFQKNNQNINWNDPDQEEDIAWENVNYNPNALTRSQMEQDILPEDKPYESLMDDRTLMAGLDDMSTYQIKDFKGLDMRDKMEKSGIEIPDPLSDEEKQRLEELRNLRNSGMIGSTGTAVAAHGGLIGSVGGTSRQKYQQGNMVGAEMEGAEMEGVEMQSQEVIKELYDAFIAQGLSPQEAIEKIKQMIATAEAEEPESPMMGEEFPGQEFSQGPRAPAAFGGIMDTYTGRRKYGLGSIFKKAKRAIKKIVKSPIGKAALLAGTMYLTRNMGPIGEAGGWKKYLLGAPAKAGAWTGAGAMSGPGLGATYSGAPATGGILSKWGLTKGAGSMMPTWLGAGAAATAAPFLMSATGNWEQDELPGMPGGDQKFDFDYGQMRKDIASAVAGGDYNEFTEVLGNYGLTEGANVPNWGTLAHGAEGGRVGAQEGGLMNLGGMEKDYRNDGGFVPLGGEEKADDVPARLSKNEFVFTADAVRNAGGGDIDRGAEVMENVMKNLEGGGKISEESQGQGAQDMFEVSERLSEVV